jgi:hypothetical protein
LKYLVLFISILFTYSTYGLTCFSRWDKNLFLFEIPYNYIKSIDLCDDDLKKFLLNKTKSNLFLDYKDARHYFFSDIDNINGYVNLVYSNTTLETESIPDPKIANCEHTWPQSLGATGIAKSDIHHLFPVRSDMNRLRSNHPFCEVGEVIIERYGSKYGWSTLSRTRCFEPPDNHKGDVSRAMFYFSIRYLKPIDSEQEYWFKKWNKEDPVDSKEIDRNNKIQLYQKNRNPFIDFPQFADLISDF